MFFVPGGRLFWRGTQGMNLCAKLSSISGKRMCIFQGCNLGNSALANGKYYYILQMENMNILL